MRTFLFIKSMRNNKNELHQYIIGMAQGNNFPSCQHDPQSRFYNCNVLEVSEKCCLDIGKCED